jgi:hypothetical protein
MIKFLSIPGELLHNPFMSSAHKMLLAYLLNLSNNDRYFFGSMDYLADQFGTPVSNIQKVVKDLIKLDMIAQDGSGALRLTVDAESLYSYKPLSDPETVIRDDVQNRITNIARVLSINKKVG